MAIKEEDLVTITSTDFTSVDYVRVLDGDLSRKITLGSFTDSIDPLLVTAGFIKSVPSTDVVLTTQTTNYTMLVTDEVILVDTTAGNVIITLPAASGAGTATTTKRYTIKKKTTDINKVSVVPSGVAVIDGAATLDIIGPVMGSITIVSDSFNWYTV